MLLLINADFSLAQHADSQYASGKSYRNLFAERGIATRGYIESTISANYNLSRYNPAYQIFFDLGSSEAYVVDILHDDIRSEGVSYGMMLAVLNHDKETFDKLWNFARNRMQQPQGWFAWKLYTETSATENKTPFTPADAGPAPDGEEYMAMALFFADNIWGSGTGNQNYREHANDILTVLRTQLFDSGTQLIKFSPTSNFTDPSYHLPAFYELWALWAEDNNDFWKGAATKSREFLKKASHPTTGLFPEYANFDGTPVAANTNNYDNANRFAYDSYRVIHNMAMDYYWWSRDDGFKTAIQRQQKFYNDKGLNYGQIYELNGTVVNSEKHHGHVWMNAVSALIAPKFSGISGTPGDSDISWNFIYDAWNNYWVMRSDDHRYYENLLHMLGLMQIGGKYPIYGPALSSSVADLSYTNNTKTQLRIYTKNTTEQSLSNFKTKYFFTVENGKTPVIDDTNTPNFNLSLENVKDNLWAAVMDYSGKTLAAGQKIPATGAGDEFTIRYSDNSFFDKSNDYSQPKTSSYANSVRVAVYDSLGNRVMGSVPTDPVLNLKGLKSSWSSKMLTATATQNDAETKAQPINYTWTSQDWALEPVVGTQHVRIKNQWTGKYLNAQNQSENAKVVTYDLNTSWLSEQWIVETISGKTAVRLKNTWSGKYLTVVDTSDYSGVVLKTLNTSWTSQEWALE